MCGKAIQAGNMPYGMRYGIRDSRVVVPVLRMVLAVLFVLSPGTAQNEAGSVRPAAIPRERMRAAFGAFPAVEVITGAASKSVPTTFSSDVAATVETVFVGTSPMQAPLHLETSAEMILPMRVGVPLGADGALGLVEPFVRCASTFVRKGAVFQAELIVGLADANPGAPTEGLQIEAKFAILVSGGEASPNDFTLGKVGATQRVVLSTPAPREVVEIAILALVRQKEVPFSLTVPVQRPVVSLNVSPESILGYGLGTATVLVQGDANTAAGESVLVKTSAGTLDPMNVRLDANRVGSAILRSTGTGTAIISLASNEFTAERTATVAFTLPWAFPLWSLGGGFLGTWVRLRGKGAKGRADQAKHAGQRLLWTGTGLSFLGAILWSLGMQVLPGTWSPALSEAAAFAVSALVGYLGSLHFPWSPAKG